jgi:hypothetical protein
MLTGRWHLELDLEFDIRIPIKEEVRFLISDLDIFQKSHIIQYIFHLFLLGSPYYASSAHPEPFQRARRLTLKNLGFASVVYLALRFIWSWTLNITTLALPKKCKITFKTGANLLFSLVAGGK